MLLAVVTGDMKLLKISTRYVGPSNSLSFAFIFIAVFTVIAVKGSQIDSSSIGTGTSAVADLPVREETMTSSGGNEQKHLARNDGEILMVFSDLDGTLLHYPTTIPKNQHGNHILKLPPSSTGMKGIISSKTLALIQDIRRRNVKFALVSGMRTSTFLNRLPYLPRADAYCTEAGGRVFYPVDDITNDSKDANKFIVKPKSYDHAKKEDLKPFAIQEDMEWKAKMEDITGHYETLSLKELARDPTKGKDLKERDGLLWDFARYLVHKGYDVDTKGYSACFRVNQKQQSTVSDEEFEALLDGTIRPYDGLSSSVNLACIDFYPAKSGKKNCCLYLAAKFFQEEADKPAAFLSDHALCLCDDDNDLEMAMACSHAFVPEISSPSIKEIIDNHDDHFTQTGGEGTDLNGTESTEAALSMVLEKITQNTESEQQEKLETAASAISD